MLYTRFSYLLKTGLVLLLGSVSTQTIAHAQAERQHRSDKPVYYCQQGHCYRAETKYKKSHNHNYRQQRQQHYQYQPHQQTKRQLKQAQYRQYQRQHQHQHQYQHQHQQRDCNHRSHAGKHRLSAKLFTGVKLGQLRLGNALRLNHKYRPRQGKQRHNNSHWHGQRQCYSRHRNTLVVKL